jgi:hypothetical protein
MQITRNFDVKVTIKNDDIVRYIKELETGSDTCRELLESLPDESLAMFTTYYLAKLYEQDRAKYEKYVGVVKKNIEKDEPKKEEIKVPELKVGSIIQYRMPDSYSSSTRAFGKICLKYEVIAKRDDFYAFRSTLFCNDAVMILSKSDFEELYKNKKITVVSE